MLNTQSVREVTIAKLVLQSTKLSTVRKFNNPTIQKFKLNNLTSLCLCVLLASFDSNTP